MTYSLKKRKNPCVKTVAKMPKVGELSVRVDMVGRVADLEESGDFLAAWELARMYKFSF